MCNVLECTQKKVQYFLHSFVQQNFHFKFLDLRDLKKKNSFAPIAFKLGSAYVSEDSNETKKNSNFFVHFF